MRMLWDPTLPARSGAAGSAVEAGSAAQPTSVSPEERRGLGFGEVDLFQHSLDERRRERRPRAIAEKVSPRIPRQLEYSPGL